MILFQSISFYFPKVSGKVVLPQLGLMGASTYATLQPKISNRQAFKHFCPLLSDGIERGPFKLHID
jgi:hypothetical protein